MVPSSAAARTLPAGGCEREQAALAGENPVAEADAAFRLGAPRFVGVYGYSISFPGVSDDALVRRIGYRAIEGTSDFIRSEGCRQFQIQAVDYAERHNLRMLELLRRR
jgi:hypothetical protein